MKAPVLFLVLFIAGCGIPGPDTSADEIGRLERNRLTPPEGPEISYLRSGPAGGARIIYVHGTPGDAAAFADYLTEAEDGREHISIDRPGFGASGPQGAVVSLHDQAAALEPLLVQRDGKWPVLVGHSLGGPIIVQAALDYPGRVSALVIISGSFDPELEKIHFTQAVGEMWPIRGLLPRMMRNSNRELLALKPELLALAARLDQLRAPVVIIHGTRDRLVPYENVAFMRRHFSGTSAVEIVTLKGRNHFIPWTAKGEIDAGIARAFDLIGVPGT